MKVVQYGGMFGDWNVWVVVLYDQVVLVVCLFNIDVYLIIGGGVVDGVIKQVVNQDVQLFGLIDDYVVLCCFKIEIEIFGEDLWVQIGVD